MQPWDERQYRHGFNRALEDIKEEGLEYAERHADNLSDGWWLTIGYRTCVDAYKEGLAR